MDHLYGLLGIKINEKCPVFGTYNFLAIFLEHRHILIPYVFYELNKINRGNGERIPSCLFEFLIFHNGARDINKAVNLVMEETIIFLGSLDNPIIHPLEITLDSGNGGFDFVTEIREHIRTDFLLSCKTLIE